MPQICTCALLSSSFCSSNSDAFSCSYILRLSSNKRSTCMYVYASMCLFVCMRLS